MSYGEKWQFEAFAGMAFLLDTETGRVWWASVAPQYGGDCKYRKVKSSGEPPNRPYDKPAERYSLVLDRGPLDPRESWPILFVIDEGNPKEAWRIRYYEGKGGYHFRKMTFDDFDND